MAACWRSQPDIAAIRRNAVLQHPVASIHLDHVTPHEAFAVLRQSTGVKLDESRMDPRVLCDERFSLALENTTVGEVVRAVDTFMPRCEFDVENDTVVVAPRAALQQNLRIYDVRDLPVSAGGIRPPADEVFVAVGYLIDRRFGSEGRWTSPGSGRLMLILNSVQHARVEEFLHAIRHAGRDGMGPAILGTPESRWLWPRSIIRIYDVRDLVPMRAPNLMCRIRSTVAESRCGW